LTETTRKTRKFSGDTTLLWVLICCVGIIPGLIYYWIKSDEIITRERSSTKRKRRK